LGIGKYKMTREKLSVSRYHPRYYRKTLAEQIIIEKAKEINDIRSALDESSIVTITDHKGKLSPL
jgi:hypothetical protein